MQQHPNEYIRGATLRFLQKIREAELLEPLIPTVRSCLVCLRVEHLEYTLASSQSSRINRIGTPTLVRKEERRLRDLDHLPGP